MGGLGKGKRGDPGVEVERAAGAKKDGFGGAIPAVGRFTAKPTLMK